ncbi:hypothetical protein [Natronococcus roseus]|uniref:hypothetical protein n=1 Tax=Natronococcus roseus TaxID=1052014 RepID=UPI00374CA73A
MLLALTTDPIATYLAVVAVLVVVLGLLVLISYLLVRGDDLQRAEPEVDARGG